jgi:two-component system cell cycle sensor histidine kinase/response regulator CckA
LIAKSGQEAIEVYRKNVAKVDLIILDMIMPDMNGQEAFDNLKKLNPAVKVLLSSGYSLNDQAQRIMDSGCCVFIQKPFDAIKLSQKIGKILDPKKK